MKNHRIYCIDGFEGMSYLEKETMDLLETDPPYGYSFMGKDWDKAIPSVEVWRECLRVLKPGSFAFIMSAPRQDVLSQMIVRIEKAGFRTDFTSIYWTYATGFPKAMNMSKAIDKKLGAKREVIGRRDVGHDITNDGFMDAKKERKIMDVTIASSPEAKSLDGSYAGFNPKPAVEIIIVAMKPLSEKSYTNQALSNGKGITWFDDCRIPLVNEKNPIGSAKRIYVKNQYDSQAGYGDNKITPDKGRFPANLLVSDDVLNDGKNYKKGGSIPNEAKHNNQVYGEYNIRPTWQAYGDSGSYSRYFNLDAWADVNLPQLPDAVKRTFPFLITPKASKKEKNKGCEDLPLGEPPASARSKPAEGRTSALGKPRANFHPTVKPIKLMAYLITLGSRPGDIILDPYAGSGTTAIAAKLLSRKSLSFENDPEYYEIAKARINGWDI